MDQETAAERYAANFLEDADQRIRFQHDYTLAGFRALFLLQGGSIVALLTYAGHHANAEIARDFTGAFAWYVGGLALTVLGYLLAYLSQGAFASYATIHAYKAMGLEVEEKPSADTWARRGNIFVQLAIAGCIASLAAFLAGSWCAFTALT